MPLSSRALSALTLVAAAGVADAHAQRPVQRKSSGSPEAQVMGYYAAVMHFTPTGFLERGAGWELGWEVTYLPNLSAEDQKVGFDGRKAENTNFCPVFPRLRGARGFGDWAAEVGYLPPIRVCAVQPHMISGALTRRFRVWQRWGVAVRASAHYGRLNAAITCGEDAIQDPTNNVCFQGQESDDRFRPFTLGLDGAVTFSGWQALRLEPYALLGIRREDMLFDVNFTYSTGTRDTTRLGAGLTRAHFAVGAGWRPSRRVHLGLELFYAPRALLTVRTRAGYALTAPW